MTHVWSFFYIYPFEHLSKLFKMTQENKQQTFQPIPNLNIPVQIPQMKDFTILKTFQFIFFHTKPCLSSPVSNCPYNVSTYLQHDKPCKNVQQQNRRLGKRCLVSGCWWCKSWHILSPLILTEHRLNATVQQSIEADHMHILPNFSLATSSRIAHQVSKL